MAALQCISMVGMRMSAPAQTVEVQEERGISFKIGPAFYRRQSSIARDLGTLLAAIHRKQTGSLRVLDVMSGCGVRAVRYLLQARADCVWANDACHFVADILELNLLQGERELDELTRRGEDRWRITTEDAHKLLLGCAVRGDYYDLIDVDSFGSDTIFVGPAIGAVKFGGLVYLTSTDGLCAGGHRPHGGVSSYGAFVNPMPYANELGLRMLIGCAVREAATRNMKVVPVFSNYSAHGPVFRAMLRVEPDKPLINRNYGFIVYCKLCGQSRDIQFESLGDFTCTCTYYKGKGSLVVSGPLWIGPLHDGKQIELMQEQAREWGWVTSPGEKVTPQCPFGTRVLQELLEVMVDESQSGLPSGYIDMHEIGRRGKLQIPRRKEFLLRLQQEGYVAARSHVEPTAVKTNCSMDECIKIARSMQQQAISYVGPL